MRSTLPQKRIGDYIELSEDKNESDKYNLDDVCGISVDKRFIETKANMRDVNLRPYYIVRPEEFAYVADTSRRGEKIAIAFNDTEETYICSFSYTVFRCQDKNKLLPRYLRLYFEHSEFNRYARFHSWGSARETFDYQIQRDKCFPLPTYDLEDVNRVKVTLYGKILDRNYTQLLHSNDDLDLHTVFLLDKVQKKEIIARDDYYFLRKEGLVEGRYPNIYVSYKVANMVGTPAEYVKNKGLDKDVYEQLIINALRTMKSARVSDIKVVLEGALPAIMDEKQQTKKVSNILQAMKKEEMVLVEGTGHKARWSLVNK